MDGFAFSDVRIGGQVAAEPFMGGVWYVVAQARDVGRRQPVNVKVCGEALTLTRGRSGAIAGEIGGRVVALREMYGLIWYCHGDPAEAQPIPPLKASKGKVRYCASVEIPADQDSAAYGLLDPAHTPFVHKSPIWRGNGILKEKTKPFEPNEFGWTMVPHAPVNSDIYKLIGGQIRVRIEFRLPGVRAEYIENSKHTVLGLTVLTPIDERHTQLRQIFYWSSPVMTLIRPIAPLVAKPFLQQDVDIMALRRKNEPYGGGRGMLLGDSDKQFLWYQSVKKAWAAARGSGTAFENPVSPATLRWRT